ncbi:MAG TPA: hypothetical protein VM422_11915 [Amaricoccus sp.]|nr:hypothetical protein [Amaricoccus sp.]
MTSKGAVGALSITLAHSRPTERAALYFGLPGAGAALANALSGTSPLLPLTLLAVPLGLALLDRTERGRPRLAQLRRFRAARRR